MPWNDHHTCEFQLCPLHVIRMCLHGEQDSQIKTNSLPWLRISSVRANAVKSTYVCAWKRVSATTMATHRVFDVHNILLMKSYHYCMKRHSWLFPVLITYRHYGGSFFLFFSVSVGHLIVWAHVLKGAILSPWANRCDVWRSCDPTGTGEVHLLKQKFRS